MNSSHFDSIATEYDDALPAHVVEHYLRKRTRFVLEHCPPGRASTSAAARACSRAGWPTRGTR